MGEATETDATSRSRRIARERVYRAALAEVLEATAFEDLSAAVFADFHRSHDLVEPL